MCGAGGYMSGVGGKMRYVKREDTKLGINEEGISCGRGQGGTCVDRTVRLLQKRAQFNRLVFENLLLTVECLFAISSLW